MRKHHLWENAKRVFRFPSTETKPQREVYKYPIRRWEPSSRCRHYPGVLFVQQGPM